MAPCAHASHCFGYGILASADIYYRRNGTPHQKQSKFAFSEPPLVDDIINIINQSRPRKSLWPVVQQCLHFGRPQASILTQTTAQPFCDDTTPYYMLLDIKTERVPVALDTRHCISLLFQTEDTFSELAPKSPKEGGA